MPTTATELLERTARLLQPGGFADARREAELLIAAMLDRRPGDLELDRLLGRAVPEAEVERVLVAAARRARREPLQHLSGRAPFRDIELAVGPGVFVPRPETELLIDLVAGHPAAAQGSVRIADIGAGSGTVAIGLARALPEAAVLALESSPHAWPWLRRNVREFAPRVDARFGDWHALVAGEPDGSFDALASNPPYVPLRAIPVDPEVRLFDPVPALYSGGDGLDEIRRLVTAAKRLLAPGGLLAIEHAEPQGSAIRELCAAAGLTAARTERDLTGRDRFTLAEQSGD